MKKQILFRALCGLLAFSMLFSFTGCNKGNDESEETSTIEIWEDDSSNAGGSGNSNSGGGTSQGAASDGKTSGGKNNSSTVKVDNSEGEKLQPIGNPYGSIPSDVKGSTVKFATWIDHKSNVETAQVIKNFESKTGIKVEIVNVAQNGYMTKLVSMIASNKAPDVFVDNMEFPVSLKIAQPVNNYINSKDSVWSKSHMKYGTINGKIYVVNGENVCWNFVNGLFFNKKVAEENGIKTPYDYRDENNWNWDTMRQYMKDYTSIPGEYYGGYIAVDELAKSAGTSLVKYNNGTFSSGIGDSNLTKAIQVYADIKKNGYMMDSTHHVYLKNGAQGLFTGTSWQLMRSAINWRDTGEDEVRFDIDNFGFIEYPGPKGGKAYAPQNTRGYGICKGSSNPKGAGYFLRWFLDGTNYDFDTVYKKPAVAKEMINRVKAANNKNGYYLDPTQNCMTLVNEKLYSTTIGELKEVDTAQVAAVLSQKSGVCNNAAKKANNLIKSSK